MKNVKISFDQRSVKLTAFLVALALFVCGTAAGGIPAGKKTAGDPGDEACFEAAAAESEGIVCPEEFDGCVIYSRIKGFSKYASSGLKMLSEEEAAEKGVPEGFSGNVLTMNKGGTLGLVFDFSDAKIGINAVRMIAIRIYVESTDGDVLEGSDRYPELRIPMPGMDDIYAVKYDVSSKTDRWIALVLYADGRNFTSANTVITGRGNALATLADEYGYLDKFELGVRRQSGKGSVYIDSVYIEYNYNDKTPPVITYKGPEVTKVPKGGRLAVDATAHDAYEDWDYPVECRFADQSILEEDGMPAVGTVADVILSASDAFGNTSEMTVKVEIAPPDTSPPEIKLGTDKVRCVAGTIADISVDAADDYGVEEITYKWDKEAVDRLGRLVAGTYAVEITASDAAGNVSSKTLTVEVIESGLSEGLTVIEDKKVQ
ncbi:MAG: PKD domain-containing protein [Clostridia bacterium]|nr:PKD domain-containing protein [Clostridia bacterium]